MVEWLTDPLAYGFMQRGILASLMVGVLCSIVGCYVVLRSMAFMGDAMAHSILPGVAIAYLLKGNLLFGALAASVIVALAIGFFSRQGTVKEDTAIGISSPRPCPSGSPRSARSRHTPWTSRTYVRKVFWA